MHKITASSDRLMHVMQLVSSAKKPVSVAELAELSGLPLSTLYRHLQCLNQWGVIQSVGNSALYCAGPLALQMALNFEQNDSLSAQAMPELQQLARASDETAALMVATGYQVVCVAMVESSQALCCSFSPGKGQALLRGASALSLLAFMPQTQSQATLNVLLGKAEHAAFNATLAKVREQGYAQSESMIDVGVWGVSAPVLVGKKLLGTLTLMLPSMRAQQHPERLIMQTRHAARKISTRLGRR